VKITLCPLLHLLDGLAGRGPQVPITHLETLPLCECGQPLELELERDHGTCVGCQRQEAEAMP